MGKNPTIYDVSRKAGVSSATVSRVLNNPGKVNADTRQAVEAAIKELGYKPLLEVRLRSVKETPRICVCAPHFTASSFVQRLRGVSNELVSLPEDYDLQVYSVNSKAQLDRFIETIEMRGIDGVIFLSLKVSDTQISKLNEAGIPNVLLEENSALTNTITNDNFEGGCMAARHLIERGYKDFGVVCEPFEWDYCVHTLQPRLDGFTQELKKNGFELEKQNIITEHLGLEDVRNTFRSLFRKGEFPRAIFATADVMAFGIIQAARDCGLEVPGDVAVIGFDDVDFADVLGLTTISQHLDESGQIAARIVASQIKDSSHAMQNVSLSLNLIEREST